MKGIFFDVGTCSLVAKDDAGWYGVQPESLGSETAGLSGFEMQPTFGFASRPVDKDGAGACTALLGYLGSRDGFAWVGHDPRYSAKCPPLTQGSSAQWNSSGAFSLLDSEEETLTIYIPLDGASKAHCVIVGKDANGKRTIELRHADGGYIRIDETSAVIRHNGNGYVEIIGDKVNVNGQMNNPSGGSFGGPSAVPVAKVAELIFWAAKVNASLNSAGFPAPPLSPTVATTSLFGA